MPLERVVVVVDEDGIWPTVTRQTERFRDPLVGVGVRVAIRVAVVARPCAGLLLCPILRKRTQCLDNLCGLVRGVVISAGIDGLVHHGDDLKVREVLLALVVPFDDGLLGVVDA